MKCPIEVLVFLIASLIFWSWMAWEGVKEYWQYPRGFEKSDEMTLGITVALWAWNLSLVIKYW
jgi:heme/copper-type cytochrome/quinol oxidase subunit 2